ncbi:MAG: hypothetical protein JWP71_3063 [Mucilaginibacter sp.]|nr:hypothetical protein [Mucilaginibacter sp.]
MRLLLNFRYVYFQRIAIFGCANVYTVYQRVHAYY